MCAKPSSVSQPAVPLAASTTLTGFFGRSSVAENLHPSHLVQWTRLA